MPDLEDLPDAVFGVGGEIVSWSRTRRRWVIDAAVVIVGFPVLWLAT